jgi:hypothetical protein
MGRRRGVREAVIDGNLPVKWPAGQSQFDAV